jgi:hypothetical protein
MDEFLLYERPILNKKKLESGLHQPLMPNSEDQHTGANSKALDTHRNGINCPNKPPFLLRVHPVV